MLHGFGSHMAAVHSGCGECLASAVVLVDWSRRAAHGCEQCQDKRAGEFASSSICSCGEGRGQEARSVVVARAGAVVLGGI